MIHLIQASGYDKIRNSSSLDVFDISYTNVRENWIHRERFLTTDEMIYLAKGELYLKVNNTKFTLHKNSFFFLHRFSTVSGYKSSNMPCEFYAISYNGQFNPDYFREIPLTGSSIYVDETLKRLYNAAKNGSIDANECNILFLSLIYEIERYQMDNSPIPLMEQTINYIDDNINNLITVDSVCDYLGYNRDYISKQFLQCYGITIKKYIDQKKLSVAKHLLTSSKMTLEQIALAIGFGDAQQFYKFFRYHEKISPMQYRKLNT